MADCLRKLVTIRSFSLLQERLDRWNQTYKHNSYDENLANACELIELNARVQSQLFKLLSLCAAEGDLLGAHPATIRARLQPLLGPDFFESAAADQADDEDDDVPAGCLSADAALSVIANAGAARSHQQPACGAPGRRFVDVDEVKIPGAELDELEHDLRLMRRANDGIRAQLVQARTELERQARVSAGEKMLADNEIRELTARLTNSEAENDRLRARVRQLEGYDRQVQRLREDVTALQQQQKQQKQQQQQELEREQQQQQQLQQESRRPQQQSRSRAATPSGGIRRQAPITDGALSDTVDRHLAQRGPPGPQSPLSLSHPWQQSRQQHLIARFNEAFTASRAEAMEALRCCYDDHENNQRIVYAAVVESFNSAKVAFRSFKARVRSHLIARRVGPDLLEEAVQDFINCHTDLYDLHTLVQEVLRCLSRNSRLYLPPGIGYDVIAPFVTECCRIAWEMTALAHPLDVAVGYDGELFDDYRYRRSYDSEFSATGVSHHIWPALMQGSGLLMKGEACTRRGHGAAGQRAADRAATSHDAAGPSKASAGRRSRSRGGGGKSGSKTAAAPVKRRPASASRPVIDSSAACRKK
ncbi:hypothetical protein BOX15_Mlig026519g1 [Macrostomum lignano]|uniref:Mitochondria-eating protein n=1 Tax=Macrostomum lignano TaxID=282301 RepID=A0A267FQJ1_9PLAT|nr:hypothetical protein BOX15_Mlig026519g1 [Macrostomum lignano]